MINKVTGKLKYKKKYKKMVNSMKPWSKKDHWDSGKVLMKEYKTEIKKQLNALQDNKCAYCGLDLNATSREEIEHIAPKAKNRYPEFTFLRFNLVLSCNFCNSSSKKGTNDTIDELNINILECKFNIVHPYFDDPDDHYEWKRENFDIFISEKTDKGRRSIDLFGLDTPQHTMERAKMVMYNQAKLSSPLVQNQLEEILDYKNFKF